MWSFYAYTLLCILSCKHKIVKYKVILRTEKYAPSKIKLLTTATKSIIMVFQKRGYETRCDMRLDLRALRDNPGSELTFDYEPDTSRLSFDSVSDLGMVKAWGSVQNHAGSITVSADIESDMVCVCGRCLDEFHKPLRVHTDAFLAETFPDDDDTDYYLIDGDGFVDLDEIVITAVTLNMDSRFLCKEDCKGLCPKCGKNLNNGSCSCGRERDERFAVLANLLDSD